MGKGQLGGAPSWFKKITDKIRRDISNTQGQNVITYPYYESSKTENGVQFSIRSDGSIKVYGTATADTYFILHSHLKSDGNLTVPFGIYTLSGAPKGGNPQTCFMQVTMSMSGSECGIITDYGNGGIGDIDMGGDYYTSTDAYIGIKICVKSGTTVSDIIFKPMLEKGTASHEYQPTNLTNKTLKNILSGLGNVGNFKAVSTEANQGLTDTEKSNARTNIGAANNVSTVTAGSFDSVNNTGGTYLKVNEALSTAASKIVSISSVLDPLKTNVELFMDDITEHMGTTNISEVGDGTVTGGLSELNSNLDTLEFDEVVGGKNLANVDNISNVFKFKVSGNRTYIVSANGANTYRVLGFKNGEHTKNILLNIDLINGCIIDPSGLDIDEIYIDFTNKVIGFLDDKLFLRYYEDKDIQYEPYIPSVKMLADENAQQNTEAMDLKMLGWTVPSECPVQNYVDGNGVFHQRVGRVDLGNLEWKYETTWFHAFLYDSKPQIDGLTKPNIYCSAYDTDIWSKIGTVDKTIGVTYASDHSIGITDTSYTDATIFKNAMQGVYLYYELETPITMPIDGNEATERINESLSDYGLDNKFDGSWLQGTNNEPYRTDTLHFTNKIKITQGDLIRVIFDKPMTFAIHWFDNSGSWIDYVYYENTKEVSIAVPSGRNIELFYLDGVQNIDSSELLVSNPPKVGVYLNNEIDELKNDLTELDETVSNINGSNLKTSATKTASITSSISNSIVSGTTLDTAIQTLLNNDKVIDTKSGEVNNKSIPTYDANAYYSYGDVVYYEGKVYRHIKVSSGSTPGVKGQVPTNTEYWKEVTVSDLFKELSSAANILSTLTRNDFDYSGGPTQIGASLYTVNESLEAIANALSKLNSNLSGLIKILIVDSSKTQNINSNDLIYIGNEITSEDKDNKTKFYGIVTSDIPYLEQGRQVTLSKGTYLFETYKYFSSGVQYIGTYLRLNSYSKL